MTVNSKRADEIAALRRLLDGCGADRTRWPAPERLRFATLLKSDFEARTMLAEAAALDRLLDRAPRVSETRQVALAGRIEALARTTRQSSVSAPSTQSRRAMTAGGGEDRARQVGVTDLAAVRARAASAARHGFGGQASRSSWHAAGLLAASLVLGILAGGSGVMGPAVQFLPGFADHEGDGQILALGLEGGLGSDEETL